MNSLPTTTCVECGGTCHLLSYLREDEPPEPGDVLAYRCADCGARWDIVWEDTDDDPEWTG